MTAMQNSVRLALAALLIAVFMISNIGCDAPYGDSSTATNQTPPIKRKPIVRGEDEPDFVTVQHILIGVKGSVPGKSISRSKDEARKLAEELFERAKTTEDFRSLVSEYTDDSAPGIYKMANVGVEFDKSAQSPEEQIHARGGMVGAFGDTGFPLEAGEVGLAEYDPASSPFGWHIVKRIK